MWVGDRKQCIFEYAGADPLLMDAVAKWVATSGGTRRMRLSVNYRSRPELVEACSELFAAALGRHGFTRDEVVVERNRETPPELAKLPPFGLWALEAKNATQDAEAMRVGRARACWRTRQSTPVVDRDDEGRARACARATSRCSSRRTRKPTALADALHARGIRAALARPGLLATPEGALVDAALRWLLDERDTLSAAMIDALHGASAGGRRMRWLEQQLPRRRCEGADLGGRGRRRAGERR